MKSKALLAISAAFLVLAAELVRPILAGAVETQPNPALSTAIQGVYRRFQSAYDRMEYFYAEVDLDRDGVKEVIAYVAGPQCGAWECRALVLKKSQGKYIVIGSFAVASNEGQIAVLPSMTKGYSDLVARVYTPRDLQFHWKISRFNGQEYQPTYQDLRSIPSNVILKSQRGKGIRLID